MTDKERRDKGMAYITDASVLAEQFKSRILQKSCNRMIRKTESSLCLLLPKRMPALPISKNSYPDIQIDLKNIKV